MGSTSKMRVPPSSKKSKVYRVVLTGGPCGGKSSALKDFTKKLNEHGYDVYTAPEVPTIMINGGCQYPGMEGKEELDAFETALLKLQLQMESSFTQCAASTGRPSVLVLDRGLMDPAAYLADMARNIEKERIYGGRFPVSLRSCASSRHSCRWSGKVLRLQRRHKQRKQFCQKGDARTGTCFGQKD